MVVAHPPPAVVVEAAAHGSSENVSVDAAAEPNAPVDAPPAARCVRVTFAVALRSDGPTSSTSTSNTVRFSPSLVSYVHRSLSRCRCVRQ